VKYSQPLIKYIYQGVFCNILVYKKAQIYNILKSLHLSFQKGKSSYPEASEREKTVEALKKTPTRKRK
jgi:transposase